MIRTRFAPSPTGLLHIGHAHSAKHAFGFASAHGGECILRIEDIDTTRCKPEFTSAIYEDLAWLGFHWPKPVRVQSEHFADYTKTLQALQDMGLVYRCFKTRKEILADIARAPHHYENIYLGPEHSLSDHEETTLIASGKPYAWRLSLKACRKYLGTRYQSLSFSNNEKLQKALPDTLGDIILARKGVGTSYHLACTHDDAHQNITHIIRGEDLYNSTHAHVLLQALLGLPTPKYTHHVLLTDTNGKRFSKRDKSLTIAACRAQNLTPKNLLADIPELG
ncbi:MAG: tRNA glutamyl-Q(34) synthetase GluQRS [Robiginitomaculum sp.]|nr:MAG: tRNA glutamyl-Q(34) synthetase GluQRS [Robiginitomaculum sp.]